MREAGGGGRLSVSGKKDTPMKKARAPKPLCLWCPNPGRIDPAADAGGTPGQRTRELTSFRVTGRTQQAVWDSLGDYDIRPALSQLDIPAVVLHGDDDPIPLESARAVADLLGAPLTVIPQCGHVPYLEAPEAFLAALDPFLPATPR